jgi:hypothetical protein
MKGFPILLSAASFPHYIYIYIYVDDFSVSVLRTVFCF